MHGRGALTMGLAAGAPVGGPAERRSGPAPWPRDAVRRVGITGRTTSETFRQSFATHLLEDGCDMGRFQELLSHQDVKTTMAYTRQTPYRDRVLRQQVCCPQVVHRDLRVP